MRRSLPLLALLTLMLSACDVAGGEWNTTITPDGSGVTEIGVGFLPDEDEVTCDTDGGPEGAEVRQETRGAETWCVYSFPFSDLNQLASWYNAIGEDAIRIRCLEFEDDTLYYDVELVLGDSDSSGGETNFQWRVTAPGLIQTHNATSVDGNTLAWAYSGPGSPLRFQVNTSDDKVCPSTAVHLVLNVNDDGTGTASLSFPPPIESLVGGELAALSAAGWSVGSIVEAQEAHQPVRAHGQWTDVDGLRNLVRSVPGLSGPNTDLTLDLTEDEATRQRTFDLHGRLDFSAYSNFWTGATADESFPPFVFDYLPAGMTETVSGDWTDPKGLMLTWLDQDPTNIPLRAVSVLQPELEVEIDPELTTGLIKELQEKFVDEIPVGQVMTNPSLIQSALSAVFSPGSANNLTNGSDYACGDYQTRVIRWLDAIRTDPDPAVRAQLAGIDYGPVQAYRGGHQAVVVFPRGTDWRQSGTVLDPWPNQRPEVFTIDQWNKRFTWGVGVGEGGGQYPHMYGNPSHYAGTELPRARVHPIRIGVNSPVAVLVKAGDGRRLGMLEDGEFVNEIEGADFYPTPRSDGEYQWYFGLPEGEYEVQLTGTDSGEMHVLVADENGNMVTYGPQPIAQAEVATLHVEGGGVQVPLLLPGGQQVAPVAVTVENVDELDFGEPLAADKTGSAGTARLAYLGLLALCCLMPPGAGIVFFTLRQARKAAASSRPSPRV
ncbi:MAG: hypothetical protein NTU91_12975 [Chloroflexi bacterium]|nr:hypothetical protein [Chloroflexota bacterium]